ncbi:MAG: hypothetical protein VXW91_00635 [Pseudomonadota bacterium]|nr:hypothetical protein [Pseudomonadota bacterium]MEC8664933.1 hypothetical protein [Pseudomonadota bacterium]
MLTLAETFAKRVSAQDNAALKEQRRTVYHEILSDIGTINSALEAIGSDTRFRVASGHTASVTSFSLRYESGIATKKASTASGHIMVVDIPFYRDEIITCQRDYGEFPNFKQDPDEIYAAFSLDAAQAAKDIIVTEMMKYISESDQYELKVHFAVQKRDQQAAQHAAPK